MAIFKRDKTADFKTQNSEYNSIQFFYDNNFVSSRSLSVFLNFKHYHFWSDCQNDRKY